MFMSSIKVKFPTGDCYLIPKDFILNDMLVNWARIKNVIEGTPEYDELSLYLANNHSEIIEWVKDYYWEDIKDVAVKTDSEEPFILDEMISIAKFTV